MLRPVLSKHQRDLFVTTGDADRPHLPPWRTAASLKKAKEACTLWIFKGLLGQAAWSCSAAAISSFSQRASPPPSSSRVRTSDPSPAHAYVHTNMPKLPPAHHILPPFLSIIKTGPVYSSRTRERPKYALLPPPPLQQKAAHSSALSAGFWVMREKQRSSSQGEKCACFARKRIPV